MTQRIEAGEEIDLESARQMIDFFRNFADGCHHGEEEDCLFPLIEQKGFSREQGSTGVMLHEHEEHVRAALAQFDAVWGALAPNEQDRVISLLVDKVDYDGRAANVEISFRNSGIKTPEEANHTAENAA